jgi:hypothetical protein
MNEGLEDAKHHAKTKYLRRQSAVECQIRKRGFKYLERWREISDKIDCVHNNMEDDTSEMEETYIKNAAK